MAWLRLLLLGCCCTVWLLQAQESVPVRVVMPQQNALAQQLVLSGSLTAKQDAQLSSRTAGLVARVLVDAGSIVNQGQPLLKLDTAVAEHELAQLQAAFNAAQVRYDEQQRLVGEAEQLISQQLFPQSELSLRQAALAEAEVEYHDLTSHTVAQRQL